MNLSLNQPAARTQRAFTIMELLVSTAVSGLILGSVIYCLLFFNRSFMALGNYIDLNSESMVALDTMSRDIRESMALQTFATNRLQFLDSSSNQLVYVWSPDTRLLQRTSGGNTVTLLDNCDYITFDISQRSPLTNGVFGFYTATNNPALCKLVSVSWRCSRKILGESVNTESVQTAKICMRN